MTTLLLHRLLVFGIFCPARELSQFRPRWAADPQPSPSWKEKQGEIWQIPPFSCALDLKSH